MFIKNILFQMTCSEFLQKQSQKRKEKKNHKMMNSTYYLTAEWNLTRTGAPVPGIIWNFTYTLKLCKNILIQIS